MLSISSCFVTFATTASDVPCSFSINATVFCAASKFKSATTTFAPSFAKRIAICCPIPDAAPVTTATFPFNFPIVISSFTFVTLKRIKFLSFLF
ncbi:3-ketoacyl-ACP reductase [Listeria monocytogenes]|nr:3-ketoacyl-ACP reductase [Listeria monocytogenes]